MSHLLFPCSAIGLLLALLATPVYGQGASAVNSQQSVVSVAGMADVTKVPEVIRLQMKQYGKGNDTETARLALMNAEKKLLKAITDTGAEVIVATAGASLSSNYRSRYTNDMQMVRQQRMLGGNGIVNLNNPVDPDKPLPTILERYVMVDLKPGNKQKEIMAIVLEVQEKLRKEITDLSGLSAVWTDEQNTPAPLEFVQRGDYYYNQGDVKIFLAAKVTKKERLGLYAEAFKRAKSTAQDLAEAAGCKLGSLQSISSSNAGFVNNYNATYYANTNNATMILGNGEVMKRSPFKDDPEIETTVMRQFNYSQTGQYDPLTFQVTLNVTYHLETGK